MLYIIQKDITINNYNYSCDFLENQNCKTWTKKSKPGQIQVELLLPHQTKIIYSSILIFSIKFFRFNSSYSSYRNEIILKSVI